MHIKPPDLMYGVKAYNEQGSQSRRSALDVKSSNYLQRPDEVILSSRGAELGQVVKQIHEVSDVRQERVDELIAKVESGDYYVSSYDIAGKMIDIHKGVTG